MPTLNEKLNDTYIRRTIRLLQYSNTAQRDIVAILQQLQKRVRSEIASVDFGQRPATQQRRMTVLFNNLEDTINDYYDQMRKASQDASLALAQQEAAHTASQFDLAGIGIDFSTPPASTLNSLARNIMIEGAPSKEWWDRQAQSTINSFKDRIRAGVSAGESVGDLTRSVADLFEGHQRKAQALVRSSVMTVANDARLSTFQENSDLIKAVQQISTLDSRTTDICIAYSGKSWSWPDLEPIGHDLPFNNGCPRHYNCRSTIVPITKSFEELGIETDGSVTSDGDIPESNTFDQWLSKQSRSTVNQLLGVRRAELYREGRLTLNQLFDQSGRFIKLDDLNK